MLQNLESQHVTPCKIAVLIVLKELLGRKIKHAFVDPITVPQIIMNYNRTRQPDDGKDGLRRLGATPVELAVPGLHLPTVHLKERR